MEILSAWSIWIIIGLILVIVEFLTTNDFGVLCFSIGAFAACLVSLITNSLIWQIAMFSLVSLVCFIFLRPVLLKVFTGKDVPTNADAIIGRTATVSETIPAEGFGRVKIDGDDWKAEAENQIEVGEKVKVVSRDGIILTVKSL